VRTAYEVVHYCQKFEKHCFRQTDDTRDVHIGDTWHTVETQCDYVLLCNINSAYEYLISTLLTLKNILKRLGCGTDDFQR
jgi:hypothetical protein